MSTKSNKEKNAFNDILNDLKRLNEENAISIFLPSCKTEVKFTPITVAQQSEIISLTEESPDNGVKMINLFNRIIKSNKRGDEEITIADRDLILLALTVKDLSIIDKIYDSLDLTLLMNKQIEIGSVQIKCSIPNIEKDLTLNQSLLGSEMNRGSIFVFEIIKFIDSISVGENTLKFDGKSDDISTMITVLDILPVGATNLIAEYISQVKNCIQDAFTKNGADIQTPKI